MSLNGLDDAKVSEAYQGALAEAGGWFLLKYTSRDEVEVLKTGSGGAADARGTIAQYEDKSPLYGFLLYRRRKVLIKYVPEGTSRLLQARVAVHFGTVTDKFRPYDTEISITCAGDLSDAALASACSLHTAAPARTSSSSSQQMQKLDNINEDAEETQLSKLNAPRLSVVLPAETEVPGKEDSTPGSPESATRHSGESKRALELSHVTIGTVSEQDENSAPRFKDLEHYESLFDGSDPRSSSQSSRPPLSDLYAEIYAQYNKPKVKLGPRPKPLLDTKRPHTSGDAKPAAKPKSSLPSGLRAAKRKTAEPKRPKSRDSSIVPSIAFPPPPPMPVVPDLPPPSPGYSPTSPASIRSLPAHTYSSLHHGSKGATLEKQRLMKALEKRKKQLQAKKEQEAEVIEATAEHVEDVLPDAAETPEVLIHDSSPAEPLEQGGTEAAITSGGEPSAPHEKVEEDSSSTADIDTTENLPTQVGEEESAEVTTNHLETDDMHSAVSVSSPRSAETQGSECAPSTRPSSMAEDDHQSPEDEQKLEVSETVQQVHEAAGEDEEASADSTPTAVPESPTPAPGVESAPADDVPMNLPQASTSDDVLTSRSKRESLVFMTSSELDDARSSRKSKRESTLFPSPPEIQDLAEGRKQKRESMILSTPTGINFTETTEKNRSVVDLPQLSAETSEAEYLSDDSFMEELQSAKFEEAMPVSVSLSRSPQASIFPRKASFPERSIPTRSPSQMFTPGRLTPEPSSSRKSSGSWLPQSNSDTAVVAKKVNVSSGISQRIQALAEKSNRDSIASVSAVAIPDSSTSIAKRKTPFFATRPSGNSPDGKPIQRLSVAPFAGQLNSMSPDNKFKISRPSTSEKTRQTLYNLQQESEKPESVQVTARIIRDPLVHTNSWTSEKNAPLELRQSDITIDHQKSSRPPSGKQSIAHVDDASPRPSSPSHTKEAATKEAAPVLPRTSSESSWKPFGRRMSESKQQRSQSSHSMESSDEKPDKKEKKESRATKMFKRMSTIPSSSKSRKNSIPTSMLSEEELPATLPSLREPPSPVQIGDLNIQFPDTLLWKRRYVEIDVSGNLVLSPSKANQISKGINKRFHLTEVRTPYAPDQDRQELPNSIVLDFDDGRTLQCACETLSAQVHVMQILREAHEAWRVYGQA